MQRNMVRLVAGIKAMLAASMMFAGAAHAQSTVVAFGDSLTAGYGLAADQSFAARLEGALKARGHDVRVVNMGVSGDTTAGGLARVDWALKENPDLVIVELGANDVLRAIDPAVTRKNLDAIVGRFADGGAKVMLAGMKAPLNLGIEYATAFNAIYPDLARQHDIRLYPFFLEGVAGNPELNQADGMHPTLEGIDIVVKGILPDVEALLP